MTCPEYVKADNKCKVDGFKFYQGMNMPCEYVAKRDKCPRLVIK